MRSPAIVAVIALAILTGACSQDDPDEGPTPSAAPPTGVTEPDAPVPDPIHGCVPACNPPGLSRPGPIDGAYETEWFFGGEMVITAQEPWSIYEDSTGEFSLQLRSTPEDAVFFWEDVYPLEDEKRVRGVPLTAEGLVSWLRRDRRLDVSKPERGTIGADIPATIVDVTNDAHAGNEDPSCHAEERPCVLWLGFPQWDDPWGIAGDQIQRVYVSDVTYGGQTHLFVAVVYPDDPGEMESFLPHGEGLIATVQLPTNGA